MFGVVRDFFRFEIQEYNRVKLICDVCGGDVQQRADDTRESVKRRLDLYEEQTAPLIDHFDEQDRLAGVNGVGHPDAVFDRLVKAVERNRN